MLIDNLKRPRAYVSLALALGPPAALALVGLRSRRARGALPSGDRRFFLGGSVLALGLYAISLVAGHADGRIVWVIVPFTIPLAVPMLPRVDAGSPS